MCQVNLSDIYKLYYLDIQNITVAIWNQCKNYSCDILHPVSCVCLKNPMYIYTHILVRTGHMTSAQQPHTLSSYVMDGTDLANHVASSIPTAALVLSSGYISHM